MANMLTTKECTLIGDLLTLEENACKKALTFTPRPSHKNIQAILSSGQDQNTESAEERPSSSQYGFTRGAEYYEGRQK